MAKPLLNWDEVETVLLDMDGTLLDLHFDNHFWQKHLPRRYADKHNLTFEQAREELIPRFREAEGSLDWYCVDYWTEQLGLDIALLKEEVDHLIAVHPEVIDFLDAVRGRGKHVTLVTNAHGKSLALKMRRTQLGRHLDTIICAHDLGLPKEYPDFWGKLQTRQPFNPSHTVLVDDNLPVLRAARNFGIAHLLAVRQPDSRRPPKDAEEFDAILSFADIMP